MKRKKKAEPKPSAIPGRFVCTAEYPCPPHERRESGGNWTHTFETVNEGVYFDLRECVYCGLEVRVSPQ